MEPKKFQLNQKGYHLQCFMQSNQLRITVENYDKKERLHYFQKIFHDEDFNHHGDSKLKQSLKVNNIQNFYVLLQQKKENKQLVLYEDSFDIVEKVGKKRSRINIQLSKMNYNSFEISNILNQYKELKNTLENIQAKTKNLERQLQLYKRGERQQRQQGLKSQKVEKKIKPIQEVQRKSQKLSKEIRDLRSQFEMSQKENAQLKNKIIQMDKRIDQVRKSCKKNVEDTAALDKIKKIIDQHQNQKVNIPEDQASNKRSTLQVTKPNFYGSQNHLINNPSNFFSYQHYKTDKFQIKANKLTLVCQNLQQNWIHMLSNFVFKQGFFNYSYKIIKSKSDDVQMIFGVSNFLKGTENIPDLYSYQKTCFVGYSTEGSSGIINYGCLKSKSPLKRTPIKRGDKITISVDLQNKEIFWTKNNNVEKLQSQIIPERMCELELYPTILMKKCGDVVEVSY